MVAGEAATNDPLPAVNEFQIEQTSLCITNEVRLLKSSRGLGWTDLFAAVTDELPTDGMFRAVPAVWLAVPLTPMDIRRTISRRMDNQLLLGSTVQIATSGVGVYDEVATPVKAGHFYLRQSFIDEVANENFKDGAGHRRTIASVFNTNDSVLQRILAAVRYSLDDHPQDSSLKMDYLSHALAMYLLTHYSAGGPGHPVAEGAGFNSRDTGRIFDYIRENLASNMSIGELADVVGLSRAQFVRRFKLTTQWTPYQFVTLLRVSKAQKLMSDHRMDLSSVALSCGFSSQSHFTTTFKKFRGVTPNEYRKGLM
jgi:AraC-like DNA-binding protein